MTISADDARALADGFLEAAQAIDDYLDANWRTMERAEYETLNESVKTLLRVGGFMTTVAVGLSIDQMDDDAAQLKQVVAEAKESLSKLKAVGQAIRVAAALVDLAAAIVSKDPGAAFKAAQGLYAIVKEATA